LKTGTIGKGTIGNRNDWKQERLKTGKIENRNDWKKERLET